MYNPLPAYLTLKASPIHGFGLYAAEDISRGTKVGISHVSDDRFEQGEIRTPLGGYINHSVTPNCVKVLIKHNLHASDGDCTWIETNRDIENGEELTIRYTLYAMEISDEAGT